MKVSSKNSIITEKWPNFFIVGAPKAGTTSLYMYLRKISGIYMSPEKEPNYFSINYNPKKRITKIRDRGRYLKLFKNVNNEKIIGEASTSYLADPDAPKLIHQISPNAKILISLRDPVERKYSNYLMRFRNAGTQNSFHDEINLKEKNLTKNNESTVTKQQFYFQNVKRYFEMFGRNQVKIIFFEEFIKNPLTTINDILMFLELDSKLNSIENIKHNTFVTAKGPVAAFFLKITSYRIFRSIVQIFPSDSRTFLKNVLTKEQPKPEMDLKDRKTLVEYFKNDVEQLQNLLGRKLPWKNFS